MERVQIEKLEQKVTKQGKPYWFLTYVDSNGKEGKAGFWRPVLPSVLDNGINRPLRTGDFCDISTRQSGAYTNIDTITPVAAGVAPMAFAGGVTAYPLKEDKLPQELIDKLIEIQENDNAYYEGIIKEINAMKVQLESIVLALTKK